MYKMRTESADFQQINNYKKYTYNNIFLIFNLLDCR
jgi:hypothetical protein